MGFKLMLAVWQWAEFKVVLFEDLVLNLQGSSCRKELSLKVSWQPQGAEGQHWALLSVSATGPEGTAWSCVGAGGRLGVRDRVCTRGQWVWSGLPRAVVVALSWLSCWSSRSVWTIPSDIEFGFWVVLCGARNWTWSLWVPYNSGYSMILCLLIDNKIDDVSVYDS